LGERLTRALITRDFGLYKTVMDLPLELEPRGVAPYTLTTTEALREDFNLYCDHVELHGITDIYRDVKEVETVSDEITVIICELQILSGGCRVVPPFTCIMTMRLCADNKVRLSRIQSSLGHLNWTIGKGGITQGKFRNRLDQTDTKEPPNGDSND